VQIFTTTLTSGTLVLNKEDGAQSVSIEAAGAAQCLFTGNLPFKQVNPTPVTITNGGVLNYAASSSSSPLDGITITWVSGSIDIIIGF
jgi:hypothetical protein